MHIGNLDAGYESLKTYLPLEEAYVLYGNLFVRPHRCLTLVEMADEHRPRVIGSYLKGMPFHAFTCHLFAEEDEYDFADMVERFRQELPFPPAGTAQGVVTVAEKLVRRLNIPAIESKQTMLLMKLTDTQRLLPPGGSRLVTEQEAAAAAKLAVQIGMVSFQPEELVTMPHLALYADTEPVALAGFHVFTEEFVEIGNIGTAVAHQKKGLGSQITSDICRLALERAPAVYLCVFADNSAAIHVYRKLGFAEVERYSFVTFGL
ncbi:GNAT family N-acetyltransferase [Brevibacillus sp. TJ4]|uniref:GNAT family N-acetyltransferase n=1 Tax=Brevibacillus sp. TJ4 TaxID=3234853 RepID=UPI003BA2F117